MREIDFEQLRAEAILHGFDADEPDDGIDPGCATCPNDAGPSGLCEDCTASGGHVAGDDSDAPDEDMDRPSWIDERGAVDLDAVRAGTPDLADAPAVLESLTDEVERLRERVADAENTVRDLDERVSYMATAAQQSRELLAAVLDAVDVPLPENGDDTAYYCLMSSRAGVVRSAIQVALEDPYNVPIMARHLRGGES